jgi:hypothetical protein
LWSTAALGCGFFAFPITAMTRNPATHGDLWFLQISRSYPRSSAQIRGKVLVFPITAITRDHGDPPGTPVYVFCSVP